MNKFTDILHDEKAREAILRGVREVVDTVKTTLGADSRNVLTDKKGKARVSDDGVSIASGIVLKDSHENSVAQAIVEVAKKTREMVGDGTTTSMVLAGAIIEEAMDRIKIGHNPMKLKREIRDNCLKVVEELKAVARPVKTVEEIIQVATVALLDEELGRIVGEIVHKVGINGFVSVDENLKYEHEFETIEGMKFYGTYASPLFVSNERKQAIFKDSPILVLGGQLESFTALNYILQVVKNTLDKDSIIILANGFSNEVVREIIRIVMKFQIPILPVKVPSFTEEQMEDIAVYVGGKFYDQNIETLKIDGKNGNANGTPGQYGRVGKLIVDRDEVTIIEGGGGKESIRCRIEMLKEHLKLESDETLKNKIKRRIGSMAEGVGVIKVGSVTEMERNYLFKKVENAVYSAKAAMEEGVVKGGGLTLKEISEKLEKANGKNILTEPLKAPYKQLKENAGEDKEVGDDVIDPVKVTRVALQNACSIAGVLITTASTIAFHQNSLEEEIRAVVSDIETFTKNNQEEF